MHVTGRLVCTASLCLLLGLSACGVKGPLEPPPQAEAEEVRDPDLRPPPPPEGEAPDEPFVLDGLLT